MADLVETALQSYLVAQFAFAKTNEAYSRPKFALEFGHLNEAVYWLAVVKFLALTPGLLYLIMALVLWLVKSGGSRKAKTH